MGQEMGPWNLVQLAFISVYPAYISYIRMVDGMGLLALYAFLVLLCIPPMFIQMKLGGYEQKGIVGVLSRHLPIAKGVGVALLIDLFLTCVYFAPLVCHFGMYAVISRVQQPYLWEGCKNPWNTPDCIDNLPARHDPGLNRKTPEREFFNRQYLQLSDSMSDVNGFPLWNATEPFQDLTFSLPPVALTLVWILVFLIIAFGAKVCGWILFLMGPAFVAILFAVLGHGYHSLDREPTKKFLETFYNLDFTGFVNVSTNPKVIVDWQKGFDLLMNSFPVWTAIPLTLGKMAGRGKVSKNIGWLLMIVVYACFVQVPQLAMAPYLGNLLKETDGSLPESTFNGIKVVFQAMPAAFSVLKVPPVYAVLFYMSLFLSGIMFLSVAMLTIVDNICDSLTTRIHRLSSRKILVNFVVSFVMVSFVLGAGIIHTTDAGMYFTIFMDQSVLRLRFITVALLAFSVIIVYVKQKFAVAEKIVLSIWCVLAAVGSAGFGLYSFITTKHNKIGYNGYVVSDLWDLISWLLAGVPYIAIPAAAIHSCMLHEGSCEERSRYLLCGGDSDQNYREYDGYYPAEPTAPPYSYGYTDGHGQNHYGHGDCLYPMDDIHKGNYDPEMEPLNTRLRTSQI